MKSGPTARQRQRLERIQLVRRMWLAAQQRVCDVCRVSGRPRQLYRMSKSDKWSPVAPWFINFPGETQVPNGIHIIKSQWMTARSTHCALSTVGPLAFGERWMSNINFNSSRNSSMACISHLHNAHTRSEVVDEVEEKKKTKSFSAIIRSASIRMILIAAFMVNKSRRGRGGGGGG